MLHPRFFEPLVFHEVFWWEEGGYGTDEGKMWSIAGKRTLHSGNL
jgi:hypothetical protein